MRAPHYTLEQFAHGFIALLPRGLVWPRDPASTLAQVCRAIVSEYPRNAADAAELLDDALPVHPLWLLTEWEKTLGLPDPCAGPSPSIALRQSQVRERFIAIGGQSVAYFIRVAAALGYRITIEQFAPMRFGSYFGGRMSGPDWTHTWRVSIYDQGVRFFHFGRNRMGERFVDWGSTVLECELRRIAPAHTRLLFSYEVAA